MSESHTEETSDRERISKSKVKECILLLDGAKKKEIKMADKGGRQKEEI